MATVTSFEALPHPSKSELRQFAELFAPLFAASSEEARRQAVAALSQCATVPRAVAYFIASQPISIAAPFLVSSPCLTDDQLITIARSQGGAHARAIVRREHLSPTVIDALVGLRHSEPERKTAKTAGEPTLSGEGAGHSVADAPAPAPRTEAATGASRPASGASSGTARVRRKTVTERPSNTATSDAAATAKPAAGPVPGYARAAASPSAAGNADAQPLTSAEREEQLRDQIRRLAAHVARPLADRLGLRTVTPMQAALLVRFARNREGGHFATTLSDILSSSRWLAERILLDLSGRQLATTLIGVGMDAAEAVFVLEKLYPHLAKPAPGATRAEQLWNGLDPVECEERIETWRRADRYTFRPEADDESTPRSAANQPANTPAARPAPILAPSSDTRSRPVLRHRMR